MHIITCKLENLRRIFLRRTTHVAFYSGWPAITVGSRHSEIGDGTISIVAGWQTIVEICLELGIDFFQVFVAVERVRLARWAAWVVQRQHERIVGDLTDGTH